MTPCPDCGATLVPQDDGRLLCLAPSTYEAALTWAARHGLDADVLLRKRLP